MAEASLSTHDLRAAAMDNKRHLDHVNKWSYNDSRNAQVCQRQARFETADVRPMHPKQRVMAAVHRCERKDQDRASHKATVARRRSILSTDPRPVLAPDDDEIHPPCPSTANAALTDHTSSESDATNSPPPGPAPDADITYSYDAPRGPGQGSQILGLALAKAVERFEGKETEKLVKEEWEVVVDDVDEGEGMQKNGRGGPVTEKGKGKMGAEEDGFELL
ncbi:MAG: hypothetical protein M1817_002802 [Caeruleum heppii]|nr:MAG: hypothetical protein M1817_002802 [Caeruleum heppii]